MANRETMNFSKLTTVNNLLPKFFQVETAKSHYAMQHSDLIWNFHHLRISQMHRIISSKFAYGKQPVSKVIQFLRQLNLYNQWKTERQKHGPVFTKMIHITYTTIQLIKHMSVTVITVSQITGNSTVCSTPFKSFVQFVSGIHQWLIL